MAKLKPGDPIPDEVRDLFVRRRKALTAGKSQYARADKLLDEILQLCEPGVAVDLDPSTKKGKPETHTLVDQFADTNRVWVGRGANRFDVKVKTQKAQDAQPGSDPEPDPAD